MESTNVNGMAWIGRILNLLAKFYWAVFILCLISLFAPSDFSKSTGLDTLKEQNKTPLWILFIFLGAWLARDIFFFIGKSVTKRASTQKPKGA
jgi:hypothetical protein